MNRTAVDARPRLSRRAPLAVLPLAAILVAATLLGGCEDKKRPAYYPGIAISPVVLSTAEGGPNVSFAVTLMTPPTGLVVIDFCSSDTTEGTLIEPGSTWDYQCATLDFYPTDWNVSQTIQVKPYNDTASDGNQTYTITATVDTYWTSDATYDAIPARTISVTNSDNDVPGVTVSKTLASTEETPTSDTFTVRLNTPPSGTVTIPVTSTDTSEGMVGLGTSPVSYAPSVNLTFTTSNWSVAQTVTIRGQSDQIDDGNQTYSVTVGPAAAGSAAEYAALAAKTVAVTNIDDDTAGITVAKASDPLVTSENETTATFTVRLNTEPTADVTVAVTSGNLAEGLLSAGAENLLNVVHLTFTPLDWATPQQVTITGQDEVTTQVPGDNVTYDVTVGPATGETIYAAVATQAVHVLNTDNDTPTVIVPAAATGLQTSETGAANTRTFTVAINKQPTSNVVIPITLGDTSEGLLVGGSSPTIPSSSISLTFTPADFMTAQVVTVIGQVDNVVDGNQTYAVTVGVPTGDVLYTSLAAQTVNVTNADVDSPGFTKSTASLSLSEGATTTFTVVLNKAPTVDVVVPVTSSNAAEGKVSTPSSGGYVASLNLTFTPGNFATPQTVTVQAQTDQVDDNNQTYTITVGPTVAPGNAYNGVAAQVINATTVDVDTAGVTVTPQTGLVVSEVGTTATFTVQPNTRPLATVTIPVSVSDSGETLVSTGAGTAANYIELSFTPDDWAAKTVTVHGQNDVVADGTIAWTVSVGPTASGDAKYQGIAAKTVAGVNLDDDATNQGTLAVPADITGLLPYASMVGSGSSYYMLTGLAAGSSSLSLTGVQGDVSLTVFGNNNFSTQQLCTSNAAGITASETCSFTVPASGTVYVLVTAVSGTTGAVFTINQGPPPPPPPPPSESEPNGTIGTADGPIGGDATLTGGIIAYDVDYFAVTNPGAVSVTVAMRIYMGSVGSCTGSGDPTLTLYTSGGSQLAYNDDSLGLCSSLTYTIPAGTTYYLKVAALSSGNTVPSYLLDVNFP